MDDYAQYKQERDFSYFHSISPGNFTIPIHNHNVNEIFLCISDNINYYVDGKTYEMNKYDIIITNNKEFHRPVLRIKDTYERKIIQFRKEYLSFFDIPENNPIEIYESRMSGNNNVIKSSDTLENNLIYYFMEIDKYCDKPSGDIMTRTLLLQLIIKLNTIIFESKKDKNTIKSDPKILATLEYINDHLDTVINLDLLSNKFFINKYYLCHLFKKHMGITIIDYINLKRIERAKHLLLEGVPVTDACYLVGFNDYSNFYKKFKKIVGLSPKKYVKDFTYISKTT
ncbi:helix-turn-helix domain-containing protein [Vallitalea guaymasensis]|uniref:Helix-turn-helix transcriptional regulator n=1 Tax=Vallitalea guaymasensis TaxID=1185412 RepID=A0A8J8SD00_9FIRM|nr:helix-turn-helix domain-containing protein [Vallitalea guaymasensis]QUH29935.1 helix-turn-helix transcriptional regulator [Vallitalea guaymasensis]